LSLVTAPKEHPEKIPRRFKGEKRYGGSRPGLVGDNDKKAGKGKGSIFGGWVGGGRIDSVLNPILLARDLT